MEVVLDTNLLKENLPKQSTKHFNLNKFLNIRDNCLCLITPFTVLEAYQGGILNQNNYLGYLQRHKLEVLHYNGIDINAFHSLEEYVKSVKMIVYTEIKKFINYYIIMFLTSYPQTIGINVQKEMMAGKKDFVVEFEDYSFDKVSQHLWDKFEKEDMIEYLYKNLLFYAEKANIKDPDAKIIKTCINRFTLDMSDETEYLLKRIRLCLNKYVIKRDKTAMRPDFIDILICHSCFQNQPFLFLTRDYRLSKFVKTFSNPTEVNFLESIEA